MCPIPISLPNHLPDITLVSYCVTFGSTDLLHWLQTKKKTRVLKFDTQINKSYVPLNIMKVKAHIDLHQLWLELHGILFGEKKQNSCWWVNCRHQMLYSWLSLQSGRGSKTTREPQILSASIKWHLFESGGLQCVFYSSSVPWYFHK